MTTNAILVDAPRNFRDTGGGLTRSGRKVRRGLLFRSGSLHQLGHEGWCAFRDLVRPRTLIDLRRPDEAEAMSVRAAPPGACYLNVPLVAGAVGREIVREDPPETLLDAYLGIASSSGGAIARFFGVLSEPGAFPAVVFCAAGKDRTGIAVAMVLAALNVEDRWIVGDYARSGTVDPRMLGEGYAEHLAQLPSEFTTAPAETMSGFLAALRREHGSVRAFLASVGVETRQLRDLEHALLEDA